MGDVGVRADEEMSEVHQDHAMPRVKRSQLSVSPLTLPPRTSAARTRFPQDPTGVMSWGFDSMRIAAILCA